MHHTLKTHWMLLLLSRGERPGAVNVNDSLDVIYNLDTL